MSGLVKMQENVMDIVRGAFGLVDGAKATNTQKAYIRDVVDFIDGTGAFTLETTLAYFAGLQASGYSASTIERKRAAVSKFVALQIEAGALPMQANPFKALKFKAAFKDTVKAASTTKHADRMSNKPEAHHLTEVQLARMLALTDSSLEGLRARAILLLGAREGLRRSEISTLRWGDIRQEGDALMLSVRGGKSPGKVRLFEGVHDALVELQHAYQVAGIPTGADDPVMVSLSNHKGGDGVATQTINRIVKFYAEAAKVPMASEITAHDLRHTCAVSMHKSGVPVASISKHLRHKDVKTTMHYLETLGAANDPALDRLPW